MAVKLFVKGKKDKSSVPEWEIVVSPSEISTGNVVDIIAIQGDDEWYLLRLNPDGTFYRHGAIDKSSGFQVNDTGKLVESQLYY